MTDTTNTQIIVSHLIRLTEAGLVIWGPEVTGFRCFICIEGDRAWHLDLGETGSFLNVSGFDYCNNGWSYRMLYSSFSERTLLLPLVETVVLPLRPWDILCCPPIRSEDRGEGGLLLALKGVVLPSRAADMAPLLDLEGIFEW